MPRGDRGGKSKGSGLRCVAANCNNTHLDGVSLHIFPQNCIYRRQWVDFVRLRRAKWQGPSDTSVLCSAHFTEASFPFKVNFQHKLLNEKPRRVTLNSDSVPTIHATADVHSEADNPPPQKKMRRAYIKRETSRILNLSTQDDKPGAEVLHLQPTEDIHIEDKVQTKGGLEEGTTDFACQTNIKPCRISKCCQTSSKKLITVTIGTQTDDDYLTCSPPQKKDAFTQVEDRPIIKQIDEPISPFKDNHRDIDYEPRDLYETESDSDETRTTPIEERKICLVFEDQLLSLFKVCPHCYNPCIGSIAYTIGSLIKVAQDCDCCLKNHEWYSQPFVHNIPAGNLAISSAILFSGSLPTKVLRMFSFLNVPTMSLRTFHNHQNYYLFPAVKKVWSTFQSSYIQDIKEHHKEVTMGGDGRADTPGHSAKYGSYSTIDLDAGLVIDVQLVQSNEVKSSCWMEKEGLVRSIRYLKENDIPIKEIITDRHMMINKWIRENMTETDHYFDVWHVAKGMKKKLFSLSKLSDCSDILPWIKSITNHMYWTAASTPENNPELMICKWRSLADHIINIHDGHGDEFHKCCHGDLTLNERNKAWLKPGTKVYEKLTDIILSKQMMKDIPRLSGKQQTSCVEGYHSVVNHFAPKMIGFSYKGMVCRLKLAALHFNENNNKNQAVTKDGIPRYRIVFPKFKNGDFSVRKIDVDCTFHYVNKLRSEVFSSSKTLMNEENIPPPLCSTFERPQKNDAVASFCSRFK